MAQLVEPRSTTECKVMEWCVAVYILLVKDAANLLSTKVGTDVIQHLHEYARVVLDRKQPEYSDTGHVLHVVVGAANRARMRAHGINKGFRASVDKSGYRHHFSDFWRFWIKFECGQKRQQCLRH